MSPTFQVSFVQYERLKFKTAYLSIILDIESYIISYDSYVTCILLIVQLLIS